MSNFSKIFEKIIKAKMVSFLTKYHILYGNQFGFRSNTSSNDAIFELFLNNFLLPSFWNICILLKSILVIELLKSILVIELKLLGLMVP